MKLEGLTVGGEAFRILLSLTKASVLFEGKRACTSLMLKIKQLTLETGRASIHMGKVRRNLLASKKHEYKHIRCHGNKHGDETRQL